MTEQVTTVNGGNRRAKPQRKTNYNRVLFIIIGLTLPIASFLLFWVYTNFSSILLAFQKPFTYEWTFDNFVRFWEEFTSPNGKLALAFKNTLIYFVQGFIMQLINLIVAFFLYKKIFMFKSFRVIFYLPAIISGVVMTTVYSEFIKPQGPLGEIMKWLGSPLPVEGLFANAKTATWAIVGFGFWTGLTGMLVYHGTLARIPIDVIEAANLDGCGPFRECASIIFPLIWPMFSTLMIFNMTGLFTASGPVLLFTQGAYNTTTISYWIFSQVYGSGAMGGTGAYGLVSAAGLCFTAIGLPIILFVRWLIEKIPAVEY